MELIKREELESKEIYEEYGRQMQAVSLMYLNEDRSSCRATAAIWTPPPRIYSTTRSRSLALWCSAAPGGGNKNHNLCQSQNIQMKPGVHSNKVSLYSLKISLPIYFCYDFYSYFLSIQSI